VAGAFGADELFASNRHRALAEALSLPTGAAGWGYRYLTLDHAAWKGPDLIAF
jgi:hypothetical protein